MAEVSIGALCPITSMAPVLAITGMVASPSTPLGRLVNRSSPGRTASRFQIRRERMPNETSVNANKVAKKELARRLRSVDPGLEVVHPNAAGIDVGNASHYVAVRPDRDTEPVRRFECFTADLYRLAEWLSSCGVKPLPLQSPRFSWIPLSAILKEPAFQV